MRPIDLDLTVLVREYESPIEESRTTGDEIDWKRLQAALVAEAEWTPSAATHLVRLVRRYGAFMLRNAAALAIAADCDDGALGF